MNITKASCSYCGVTKKHPDEFPDPSYAKCRGCTGLKEKTEKKKLDRKKVNF